VNHSSTKLTVVYKSTEALTSSPHNARTHSKRQIRQIAASVKEFGWTSPILLDEAGTIVAGHGRVQAAKLLGMESVPTIQIDGLTSDQIRALIITENRLAEKAGWDDGILKIEFQQLLRIDSTIEPTITGFEWPEIDLVLISPDDRKLVHDPDDAFDAARTSGPVTQPGDLWHLGKHLLLCGSALDPDSFSNLMGEKQAGMVFVDPPYNLKIDGNVSGKGAVKHGDFAMASGEMSEEEFSQFLKTSLGLLARYSLPGSLHYVATDWRHICELGAAGNQAYGQLLNLCVWTKERGGQGSFYRSQHELFFVFKNGDGPSRNRVQLGKFGRNRTNVWKYPSAATFSKSGEEGNLLALHPTVKPVALVADAILDCSSRGEIVLDSFLGSGTTLIAAERTGRICHGIELDPRYVDTAIRRWQRHTGDHAIHAVSGKQFDEIANQTPETANG
jgi:DNA modification methylase